MLTDVEGPYNYLEYQQQETMSNTFSTSSSLQQRIWLSLRLGWALSQVYGRLTQPNIRWANLFPSPPDKPVERLFLSTREPYTGEAIWADMQSLIYLVQRLYPVTEENKDTLLADLRQPPDSIDEFLAIAKQVMLSGEGEFSLPKTFHNDLNHWSRDLWAILDAEDPLLAEAATLGGGLADTFWQWRLQKHHPHPEQTWQKLLKPARLRMMIRRVRQIEDHLPIYVGPTLRHSIWEWSKAADNGILLEFSPSLLSEEETVLPDIKARNKKIDRRLNELSESSSSSQEELKTLIREKSRLDEVRKKLKNEEDLKSNFHEQLTIWEDLVFNRPITYQLNATDWWSIRLLALTFYAIALVVAIVIPALLIYGLISITNSLLSIFGNSILNWLGGLTEFDDQLKLATSVITVLAFLLTQSRKVTEWIRQLYPSIYNWFFMSKLIQRTFYSWDGQPKALVKIWWRRLWLGDN